VHTRAVTRAHAQRILMSDLHFEIQPSAQIRCNQGRTAAPFCRPTFTAADPAASHGCCHETRIQRPCPPCSANARPVTCGKMIALRCTDTYSTRDTQRHRDCTLHHTPQHTPGLGSVCEQRARNVLISEMGRNKPQQNLTPRTFKVDMGTSCECYQSLKHLS